MDKKTILIVEGEQIAAMDLRQVLESLGYRVAGIARTGERAVEMADAARPDLILMDLDLAGAMTGIETAEQIARRHAIPVIYLADSADPELVGRAAKTRPYGYIVKPWNERDIRAEISIALYKSALEEAFRKEHADLEEWLRQRTDELRHADRELRRSEAWYRLIFERSGEGIFIFEAEGPDRGRFIDVNAAGAAIHGYTRDDLLAMKITDLDVPENVEGAPAGSRRS
jgi:AmiR/NasT family two-component response regulator